MQTVKLEVTESQIVGLVKRLSPAGKQAVLRALIPRLERSDSLMEHGEKRARELAKARGLHWDHLNEDEREGLIDDLLHGD